MGQPSPFTSAFNIQNSALPLLTLDRVSLSFGHLPLFDDASLRIEAGERICLIGRNGTGKSSLLKVIAGDVPPDGGSIWRAPGLRVSRLDQDVPGAADRTVFDEVAAGLGSLGALVAQYHHAAVAVAEAGADSAASAASLDRFGELQHELEERDGWRLEQRVETVVSRLSLPAERSLGELSGGWRRRTLLGKALVSQPDLLLLDEPTNHLDIDAIRWLEGYLREFSGALLFVTHDRAFLSALATRIVDLDRGTLTSWPGAYSSYLDKKAEAENADARALDRLDKKLEKEEAWLRQGVKARRTRNEGRVRALLALRAERVAERATSGDVRLTIDATESSGRLVFEADTSPSRLQMCRWCATTRSASCAAIASASSARTGRARRRCSSCWWGTSNRTRAQSPAAPGCELPTSISNGPSSIPSSRSPTASTTATTP